MLGPKHEGGPYGEGRAFSIVGGDLPARLIDSCRNKRAVDLSPTLSPKLPLTSPGIGTGQHRQVYLKIDFLYSEYLDMWHHAHLMDAMAGTHLVPPSFALPPEGEQPEYAPEVRGWLEEYEKKYGQRGTSDMTTEQVPLDWTCGPLRVIDVRSLVGTTDRQELARFAGDHAGAHSSGRESAHGALQARRRRDLPHGASRQALACRSRTTPASGPIRCPARAKAGRRPARTRSSI